MRPAKILENVLKVSVIAFLLHMPSGLRAQERPTAKLLDFQYGFQFSLADLQDRFGGSNDVGIGIETITIKNKVFLGVDERFFFGGTVKEDVLESLRSYDGNIIGIDGKTGDVSLKERGFYVGAHAGKIFPTTDKTSSLTGIRTQIGFGLLQHHIRIQDNGKTIVALEKENLHGYDRLTNGPALQIGLGYQYDSPINNFHFKIMSSLIAGQTKSRRDLDYATGTYLGSTRTDILFGLNISYVVTISRNKTEEFIYY